MEPQTILTIYYCRMKMNIIEKTKGNRAKADTIMDRLSVPAVTLKRLCNFILLVQTSGYTVKLIKIPRRHSEGNCQTT